MPSLNETEYTQLFTVNQQQHAHQTFPVAFELNDSFKWLNYESWLKLVPKVFLNPQKELQHREYAVYNTQEPDVPCWMLI